MTGDGDYIVRMGKTIAQKGAHVVKDGIRRKTAVGDTTKAYFNHFLLLLYVFVISFDSCLKVQRSYVAFWLKWLVQRHSTTGKPGQKPIVQLPTALCWLNVQGVREHMCCFWNSSLQNVLVFFSLSFLERAWLHWIHLELQRVFLALGISSPSSAR